MNQLTKGGVCDLCWTGVSIFHSGAIHRSVVQQAQPRSSPCPGPACPFTEQWPAITLGPFTAQRLMARL